MLTVAGIDAGECRIAVQAEMGRHVGVAGGV